MIIQKTKPNYIFQICVHSCSTLISFVILNIHFLDNATDVSLTVNSQDKRLLLNHLGRNVTVTT